jgi:hypothetical protein
MEQHLSVLLLLLQHLKTGKFFPFTKNYRFVFSAPGEWQTNATGLLLLKSAIKAIEFCLSLNPTMARDLLDKTAS